MLKSQSLGLGPRILGSTMGSPFVRCLDEREFLELLGGEPAAEEMRAHVNDCAHCRGRLDQLRAELSAIRAVDPGPEPPRPFSADREQGQAPYNGSRPSVDCQSSVSPTESLTLAPDARPDGEARPDDFEGNEPSDADEIPMPAKIGKYLVVGRFPRSGQAQVFRVVHPELRRDLVVKVANQAIGADGRSAVAVEGQRLAELEHPNIVRVYDLDFHEGCPCIVMEYVRGRTLAQYAREQAVTPRQSAALVAEIAGAVAFAHRRGIVHQDIKPANVLIDETGRPRLIDFGLACQQDAWSEAAIRLEGGTFAYMAPEQARRDLSRVRPLADVFALGGLLYFLLTGKGPFEAATPEKSWDRARRCDFDRSALENADVPRG